ncbi:hypothetical protein [Vibrio sp. AND4]|uniref:hypothetical protein n=1 Tax=Vibrio sp. AND4 TaxID=314289 RepID=UPI00015F35A3|nr:hypothetical protein [Vibrio sp. AND4]EDP59614.1 hypothetical protein AND4_10669 [Vibrio sp. AND4]
MILEKLKRSNKNQASVKGKSFTPYMIIVMTSHNDLIERVNNYFSAYNVDIIDYKDDIHSLENLFNLHFKSKIYVITDEITLREKEGFSKFLEVTSGRVGTLIYGEREDLDYYWSMKSLGINEYTWYTDTSKQVFNTILWFFGILKSNSSHWFLLSDTTQLHGDKVLHYVYENWREYVKKRPSLNTLFINLDVFSISLDARIGKKADPKIINMLINGETVDAKAAEEYIIKVDDNFSYFSIDVLHQTTLHSIDKIASKLMSFFNLFDGDFSYIFIYVPFYLTKIELFQQLVEKSDNITMVTDASLESVYMLKYLIEQEIKARNKNIKTFQIKANKESRYLLDKSSIYKKTGQRILYNFNPDNKKRFFNTKDSKNEIITRLVKND